MPAFSYGPDAIFDHYIRAVMRQATVEPADGRWQARVFWDTQVTAVAATRQAAELALAQQLVDQVFARMRRGDTLRVINGIDINPGSC